MPLDLAPSREVSRLRPQAEVHPERLQRQSKGSTRTGNIVRGRNARRSDHPVDRAHLHHRLSLGAALFDHDPVEPLDRVAARRDAPAGNDGMDERAEAAPDHRHPEFRRSAAMLAEILIHTLPYASVQIRTTARK